MGRSRSGAPDALAGVAAGVLATWVMSKVTTFLYEHEDPDARNAEDEARGGKTAFGIAAEKLAETAGLQLSDEQRQRFGSGLHWGLGAGAGAVYGVLRHRLPPARWGSGVAFGTAFWALVDEGATTVLGLTPPPQEFPWQAHARGLAGHVVFGVTADLALRAADRLLHSERPSPLRLIRDRVA